MSTPPAPELLISFLKAVAGGDALAMLTAKSVSEQVSVWWANMELAGLSDRLSTAGKYELYCFCPLHDVFLPLAEQIHAPEQPVPEITVHALAAWHSVLPEETEPRPAGKVTTAAALIIALHAIQDAKALAPIKLWRAERDKLNEKAAEAEKLHAVVTTADAEQQLTPEDIAVIVNRSPATVRHHLRAHGTRYKPGGRYLVPIGAPLDHVVAQIRRNSRERSGR